MDIQFKATMWVKMTLPNGVDEKLLFKYLNEGYTPSEISCSPAIPFNSQIEWEHCLDTVED